MQEATAEQFEPRTCRVVHAVRHYLERLLMYQGIVSISYHLK